MSQGPLDKIIDPFVSEDDADANNIAFYYHSFENIRTNCSFHLPNELRNVLTESTEINILHLKARSLVNKLDNLRNLLNETATTWHVISISETWIAQNIEKKYNLSGYQSLFCSRNIGAGGGSAIYIKSYMCSERLDCPAFTTAEIACAQIHIDNTSIIVCQIYRSPSTDKFQFSVELERCLIWLAKFNKTTLITGDFNFDLFASWSDSCVQSFLNTQLSHGFSLPSRKQLDLLIHLIPSLIIFSVITYRRWRTRASF